MDGDALQRLDDWVTKCVTDGLGLGLVPPSGAVVMAISDGSDVLRVKANMTPMAQPTDDEEVSIAIEVTASMDRLQ